MKIKEMDPSVFYLALDIFSLSLSYFQKYFVISVLQRQLVISSINSSFGESFFSRINTPGTQETTKQDF
jgi:hypothetical protein